MVNVKQLISENNQKRKLLNEENEMYYEDVLLYLRLQWKLLEQQTEEVLIEVLDHLLEGQEEGKTAQDIFGEYPKQFADELIAEITNEEKKRIFFYFSLLF